VLVVYGRTPLFYFVAHFFAAHAIEILLVGIKYGAGAPFLLTTPPSMGGPLQLFPPGFGFDLWVVYAVWAAIVVGMYPACKWFGELKARRRDWWLSYL
jgi:hypothetical protein